MAGDRGGRNATNGRGRVPSHSMRAASRRGVQTSDMSLSAKSLGIGRQYRPGIRL